MFGNLLPLFESHPLESVIEPKGDDHVLLDIPTEFLTIQNQKIRVHRESQGVQEVATIGQKILPIKKIVIPDLTFPLSLGRQKPFSIFNPEHKRMAAELIQAYMDQPTADEVLSLAVYLHDRVNPLLGLYAVSVAVIHRKDTRDTQLPLLAATLPDRFVDSESMGRLRSQSKIVEETLREVVAVTPITTASDLEEEQKLFYFREDLGVNLHHWHWHLAYPGSPLTIAAKDRRGELFYYMHQQIIARYNFERIGNKMPKVKSLSNLREPVKEGYYSKLNDRLSSANWPGRPSFTRLTDLEKDTKLEIHDLESWKQRIIYAIHKRAIIGVDGKDIPLDEETGIDILGNLVEATDLSKNSNFYGSLHNQGHNLIANAHDPDGRHMEHPGVMGEVETAMRDPIFYRWHSTINDIFVEYKSVLKPYSDKELKFDNIEVKTAAILTGKESNVLRTKWDAHLVNVTKGLDFRAKGKVLANFTHLQHEAFSYKIEVDNKSGNETKGTCRIFLAPKFDERGLTIPFVNHKDFFIEMDKFVVTLANGTNKIERKSSESSVIIPFDQTFPKISDKPEEGSKLKDICRCGWPEHMLVPRGTKDGLPCWLFVMISNYEDDQVKQDTNDGERSGKSDGASYCGVRDKKYPDKRAMGFPFDRLPSFRKKNEPKQDELALFVGGRPNMKTVDVTIYFSGKKQE